MGCMSGKHGYKAFHFKGKDGFCEDSRYCVALIIHEATWIIDSRIL